MIDYYTISNEYNKLNHGPARMAAIKKSIDTADKEKDYNCATIFRYDYIYEAVFYDDIFKAIIMFPEYLNIYDENYDEITYRDKDIDLIYSYSWIISNSVSFYQISMKKINEYLEDFKRRLIQKGYSLKIYYYTLSRCLENIDEDKYKDAFNKYLDAKADIFGVSKEAEMFDRIYFEMYHGSYKKAIELVKVVFDGGIDSSFYNNIIYYHVKNNTVKENLEELSRYESVLYKEMKKFLSNIACINTILDYCAIVNVDRGVKIFKQYLSWNLKIRNPKEKFYFELSSYRLFRAIKEKKKRKIIKLNLNESFELYKEDGIYSIDELIDYFKSDAIYIAKKFDERNGNNFFMKEAMNDNFLK